MNLVNLSGYSSDSSECVEFGVCQFGEPGESSNYCFVFFGNFAYFFAFGERFNSSPKFWKTSASQYADVIIAVGS